MITFCTKYLSKEIEFKTVEIGSKCLCICLYSVHHYCTGSHSILYSVITYLKFCSVIKPLSLLSTVESYISLCIVLR